MSLLFVGHGYKRIVTVLVKCLCCSEPQLIIRLMLREVCMMHPLNLICFSAWRAHAHQIMKLIAYFSSLKCCGLYPFMSGCNSKKA